MLMKANRPLLVYEQLVNFCRRETCGRLQPFVGSYHWPVARHDANLTLNCPTFFQALMFHNVIFFRRAYHVVDLGLTAANGGK